MNEVNQDTLKAVFKFEGMTISERGLTSVRKYARWSTDDIMAYTLCHVEFE